MGVREHFLTLYRHHRIHHSRHYDMMKNDDHKMKIPKGYVVVMVGHEDEERTRYLIPVLDMNHPLFLDLLKEAEEEFGFHHGGPINIPCNVQEFNNIQGMIHQDHPHQNRSHIGCFS